jgi:FtsH-binding integral membrane protein
MASLPAADPRLLFWLFAVLHFAGLASMFLARLPQGKRGHAVGQLVFFTCLFVVGMATMYTIVMQHHAWVWSGTTFSLMAVGGTIELGPARAAGF